MNFSIASVVLSLFVGGGIGLFVGTLIAGMANVESQIVVYLMMAAGSFLGGFAAARAKPRLDGARACDRCDRGGRDDRRPRGGDARQTAR